MSTSTSGKKPSVPIGLLAPQAFVGLMDAISYMVTAPSIIFYVLANGGSYDSYGIILSSFSFSSFCFKPILGYWCDKTGCFREPYMLSLVIAALGGLVYFMASSFQDSNTALAFILLGRLMGGVGSANQTLGYTYIARVVDKAVLTQASAILSMVRVLGMATAPGMNVFLHHVNATITIGSVEFILTPLNSVGLFLFVGNVVALLGVFYFLHDPEPDEEDTKDEEERDKDGNHKSEHSSKTSMWEALLSIEVVVPMLSAFALNSNFQLMETGMAPVASDALGWGPVSISAIFGGNAILILGAIILTFRLSSKGVKDETLLSVGLIMSAFGYTLMYFLWIKPTHPILFVLPIVFSTVCFPFLGSPTRSIYTMVIDSKPSLRHHQGTMQAIMSMVVSIAGFVAPGLISSFILRTPEEVSASEDHREFSPWALFAPVLSLLVLAGHLYIEFVKKPLEEKVKEASSAKMESTSLVRKRLDWSRSRYQIPSFDARTSARRRDTITVMGIPQVSYEDHAAGQAHTARRQSTGTLAIPSFTIPEDEHASRRLSNWF
jgi:ceroid-lipofuscinosis MFS transporter 7